MTQPKQKKISHDGIELTRAVESIQDNSPISPIELKPNEQSLSSGTDVFEEVKAEVKMVNPFNPTDKPLVLTKEQYEEIKSRFGDGSKQSNTPPKPLTAKEKEQKRLAYETEMTKGIFRNFEKPGSMHEFSMRLEAGPVQSFKLYDGQVHELPRNVARYINQHCWYPEHEYAMDEHGSQKYNIGKKVHRFAFDNGEYYEDAIPALIQVASSRQPMEPIQQFMPNRDRLVPVRR